MRTVHVGVQETDGDALVAGVSKRVRQRFDLGAVEGDENVAPRAHALADDVATVAGDERLGQRQVQVVLLEAALRPHLDDVAKALRRDQSRLGAAPFNQRVGRQRRAVDDLADARC